LENTPTSQSGQGPSLQDLYPETPSVDVATPTTSGSVESDQAVTETGGATTVGQEPGQLADQELARIISQDSPLMARARAEGMQFANKRGLMNTSMAAGATMGAMVDRAMPMALQNAQQNLQRGMFNAQQQNDINTLEAQLRTALEQGDTDAANAALRQMDAINRDAEAQQADIDYGFQSQVIQSVTALNEQYLRGTQAIDLADVQGSWQQLITTNEVAGSFWNNAIQAISQVMANPDMTPAQIASAVEQITKQINGGLEMIANINEMDFSDLVDTTAGPGPGPGPGPRRGGRR
jgi:ribosomal protein S20